MMRIEAPKQREWSKDLLDKAVEFHGHGGPFMVVGLRMGARARKKLWVSIDAIIRILLSARKGGE